MAVEVSRSTITGGMDALSMARRVDDAISRSPMTILHIVEAFGGGVETAIRDYVRSTPELDHWVLARARKGNQIGVSDDNLRLDLFEGSLPQFLAYANRSARRMRPDAIHLHSSFAGLLRALPLPPDSTVVYSPHCYAFQRRDVGRTRRKLYRWVERTLAPRGQAIVAVSPREQELAERLAPRSQVAYVPNISRTVTPLQPRPARRVVTVGRVCPQKDPDFFAGVATALRAHGIEAVWVGGGGTPGAAKTLQDAGCEITGWLPQREAMAHLANAGLYVHTAAWEGAPLTLIEAAAAGVPVLARDIPSVRSLGYPTVPGGPQKLAEAVIRYFDEPDFAADVVRRTEDVVATMTPEKQRSALLPLYRLSVDVGIRSRMSEIPATVITVRAH